MERETRQVDFTVTRAEDGSDGLTLEGYAAVFNTPTRIDSAREGKFDEVIAPGAFKRTVDRKGAAGIRLQFDHGQHPLIGSIPIGAIDEVREDSRGLFVRARMHDNWLTQPVRDAIASGSVSGMSFQFRVVVDEWDHDAPDGVALRTVREVELFELGPVVWPAYDATTVGVRSLDTLLGKVRGWADSDNDFRDALRGLVADGTSDEPVSVAADTSDEPAVQDDDPAVAATRRSIEAAKRRVVIDLDAFIDKRKDVA